MIGRVLLSTIAICVATAPERAAPQDASASPTVVVGGNEYLVAGADAMRAGQYDDGIRLTLIGIERGADTRNRAAGLANLCAAHVAKNEPDKAIPYCTESLLLNDGNWRAYSNRSQAYLQKDMYTEAAIDNDAAAVLNPNASHVRMVREMLNEQLLRPNVVIEEHL